MNMILSILVCFAMLFSGGAALPSQPETATVRTLRNLSVTTDEGSVTLAPELRLTTAIGSEAALMQFEVVSGDDVLLPLAGELTKDGVRFRLSDGGSVYSLTSEALLELMDADAEGLQPLTYMTDYLSSYSALLQRSMGDASYQQELSRTMIELLVSACGGETEQVTLEIGGAELPAQHAQLEITPEAALDLLDGLASCGVTEVEDMLNSYMLLLTSTMGESYDSLSDFTAGLRAQLAEEDMENEISIPMELTWTTEGPVYVEIAMDFDVDDTSAMQLAVTSTSTDERTDLDMTLSFTMDDGMGSINQMDFRMTEQVDGPLNAPEKVQLNLVVSSQSDWNSEYEDEGVVHSYVSSSAMNLALDVNAEVVNGLERATIDLTGTQRSSYDYDGDVNTDESGLRAHISADDRSEADGSVTTAVAMDIDADGENVQLSWELNRAEGMPVPSFDESKTVDLAEILGEDEGGAASIALASDALKLSADATALCADESVLAMLELLDIEPDEILDDVYEEDDYGDDDTVTGSEEIGYGDDDTVTVYSMDEAAQIYAGVLPAFTVPEGLELDEIYVSESYLDAYYSSPDGERYLDLSCFDYGYSNGEFYVLEDGALVPADVVVNISALDEENTAFSADLGVPTGMCSFSFYGFAREEVESFLTTLQF